MINKRLRSAVTRTALERACEKNYRSRFCFLRAYMALSAASITCAGSNSGRGADRKLRRALRDRIRAIEDQLTPDIIA